MDCTSFLHQCQQAIRDGRLADAEAHCRAALALLPESPSALNLMGVLHRRAGRLADAEATLARALALAPQNAALNRNLGLVELSRGKVDPALEHLRTALRLQPESVEGHLGLARACARTGRDEEALLHFSEARALAPEDAEIPLRMGRLLLRLGQYGAARESFEASRALKASAEALAGLAEIALACGVTDEAEALCHLALTVSPGHVDALVVLSTTLFEAGRPHEALVACEDALARAPGHPAALARLARVQRALGHFDAAEETHRCARAMAPLDLRQIEAHAHTLIAMGRTREGWDLLDEAQPDDTGFGCSRWAGQPLDGKTLLLHTHDARDALQFCRYAVALMRLGARVIARAPAAVLPLLETVEGIAGLERQDAPARVRADLHCPMQALPRLPEFESDGLPDEVPYLQVPAHAPPSFIGGFDAINVGLAWRSDRSSAHHVPLQLVEPAMRMHGLRFHALMRPTDEDEARLLKQCEVGAIAAGGDDLAALAAAISSLDLIVTADSVIAHLAGALGRPVWLLAHFDADWRWQSRAEASPWYPTLRLFRQRSHGDWLAVTGQLVIELARLVGGEVVLPHLPDQGVLRPNVDFPAQSERMRRTRHADFDERSARHGHLCYPRAAHPASQSIALYGEYLQQRVDLLARLLQRGDTALVGGAAFGPLAIALARRVGPQGRVLAWESDAAQRRLLERNCQSNRLTQVSLLDIPDDDPERTAERLDTLDLDRLRLLVMDLERLDHGTLRAASALVERLQPLVYLLNAGKAADWLQELGYRHQSCTPRLFSPANHAGVGRNVFGDAAAADLLGVPADAATDIALTAGRLQAAEA